MTHQYTENEKARIRDMIVVFQEAQKTVRQSVRNGGGLCFAISLTKRQSTGTSIRARIDAASLVMRSIAGHMFLEGWQASRGRPWPRSRKDGTYIRRLGDRRRWLDQLIRDCQAALVDAQ